LLVAVAGDPARQFGIRVGAARGVDLGDILRVLHEFDDQPVGAKSHRWTCRSRVCSRGRFRRRFEPPLQSVIGLGLGLEGDVVMRPSFWRLEASEQKMSKF
jgi:hypothetical protein